MVELNVLNTTKLLKNQRHVQLFIHIYQLKLIPPTGIFSMIRLFVCWLKKDFLIKNYHKYII